MSCVGRVSDYYVNTASILITFSHVTVRKICLTNKSSQFKMSTWIILTQLSVFSERINTSETNDCDDEYEYFKEDLDNISSLFTILKTTH